MSEEWQPGRWYRIMNPDGTLWMETSDPFEAEAESLRTRTESEWRPTT